MKELNFDKLKRFICLLLYTIVVGFIIIYGEIYESNLEQQVATTYKNFTLCIIYAVVFPVFIGMLIALPHLLKQFQKRGRWSYDWVIFIAVGIPALYVDISWLLCYSPIARCFPFPFTSYLYMFNMLHTVSGIVFGLLLLGLLKKVKDV